MKPFNSIKQGLDEALESSKVKKRKAVVHKFGPVDVKTLEPMLACLKMNLHQHLV